MVQINNKKKIGNTEVFVTLDFLKELREKSKADYAPNWSSYEAFAEYIKPMFPKMSVRTIAEYISVVLSASDYIFGLVMDKQISVGMLKTLCQGELDIVSRDTLAQLAVSKGMSPKKVGLVKKMVKASKGRLALAEAVMRANGEIPIHAKPEHVQESMKTFGKIVGKVVDSSIRFMTDLQVAMDLLPHSAIANGESYMGVYEKINTFEVALENSLHFVRERKKRFFESLKQHIMTEAEMNQRRIEGGSRS